MNPLCISCSTPLPQPYLDLGETPLANSYVPEGLAHTPEPRFPLAVCYCPVCHLSQLKDRIPPEALYSDYSYFSSFTDSWVAHSRRMADSLISDFSLTGRSRVLEIASNDGYLLQFFQKRGVHVLGVEPARNIAEHARQRGIPTVCAFFEPALVPAIRADFGAVDLIIGNNVLAHVPQVNGFLSAVAACLAPNGHASFEFPYLKNLLDHCEFDTIYHEHVSYFSMSAVQILAARNGLKLIDAQWQPVHGGSMRIYLGRQENDEPISSRLQDTLADEERSGLTRAGTYHQFSYQVRQVANELVSLLQRLREDGKRIAAYGAPAKGNTLLNFCGITTDLIEFTVDRSPHKQGRLLPGSRIPILDPEALLQRQPDYAVILPWNIAPEIAVQQDEYLRRGGEFIVPVPHPVILENEAIQSLQFAGAQ